MRIVVAGGLPREPHNAPLHLFSASPELVGFGSGAFQQRSESTSRLLKLLFESFQEEDFAMSYTMEDFNRDYFKRYFPKLTQTEQEEVLKSVPPETRLTGLSEQQIRKYLKEMTATPPRQRQKTRRKK